jgi:YidC/Oxa1 family membrane protein insertase
MLVTANIFQPLIDVFESVLKAFHGAGISWGWSIVLLTVCVRAVLVPLTFRQIKSMVRMQALAPQMKEIQAKYKDDRERQSQEMMKFYRENNVNPLGSCLPLVLQLPVFVSLYYMLRNSLRGDICPQVQAAYQAAHHTTGTTPCGPHGGASFLFIPDLTNKASGWVLIVLLILYVGTQLGSTLVMSSAATMDPMQRRLMMFLPLIFVLFVFRFPAGVLVYWITTNFWTMGQQWVVRQRVGPRMAPAGGDIEGTAGPPSDGGGKTKGSGPRSGPGAGAATKALPKGDAANGGDAAPATGGLSSFFRSRTQPAADADAATNGKSNGSSAKSSSGSGAGSGGRSSRAKSSTPQDSSSRKRGGANAKSSGGGSSSGDSSTSGGAAGGAKPPPPPRKRKKRSGRRR